MKNLKWVIALALISVLLIGFNKAIASGGLKVYNFLTGGTLTNTKYCTYNSSTGYIDCNSEGGGSFSGTLNDISDVATTTTSYGDVLTWSGSSWTNFATSTLYPNIANWNTAYGWGNHATAGYLTSSYSALATSTFFGLSTWFATTSAPQITTMANLASVGTITTGTWSGTAITVAKGGTGLTSVAAGSLLYASAANTISALASSSPGYYLAISATTGYPAWQRFTIPNSATLGIPSTAGSIGLDTTTNQIQAYGSASSTYPAFQFPAFSYSTSTAWSGTTTMPLGTAFQAETWSRVQCFTDTGTAVFQFGDGTNKMQAYNASTTANTNALSTNNTFTAAEKRYVDIGTPASTPTKISCTIRKAIDPD